MGDSPDYSSKKRGRDSEAASLSSSSQDAAEASFDAKLSDEFREESPASSETSLDFDGAAEENIEETENIQPPRKQGDSDIRFRVYEYNEQGERVPSQQAPRPQRPQAGQAGQASRPAGRSDANRHQSPGPADEQEEQQFSDGSGYGDGGFDDFAAEFQGPDEREDIWDDEETAEGAKSNPAWAQRMKREFEEWEGTRHILAAALLRKRAVGQQGGDRICCTEGCGNVQAVRCAECLGGQPMCSACDERSHPHAHFHHRSYLMDGHFWKPIGPDFAVQNGRLERVVRLLATRPSVCCSQCSKTNWGSAIATNKPLTLVTLAGRFDFFRAVFQCQTDRCGGAHEQGAFDCVDLGAWPGTISDCRTMYDTALLEFWDKMSKDQPGASMTALVKVLEGISRDQGRVASINRHSITTAFGEFKMAQHTAKYPQSAPSGFVCPACWEKQHSCMVDGNRKLYRWARAYDPSRKSYYEGLFFFPDADVQASIRAIDTARGVERPDTGCGGGEWKAARDSKSAIRGQDETGCSVCGCRHVFAQRAVNIIQSGERYGNAYYLDQNFMQPKGVQFEWQDIICKYWVWREKVLEAMDHGSGGGLRPALNLMHGKLHSWQCQVLFGGQWQDGAAAGSGEDMELLFSYLSRLGIITKVMGPARRVDVITEAALHWNEAKARLLAQSLVARFLECQKRLTSAIAALETACQSVLGVAATTVPPEKLEGWKSEIRGVAETQLRESRRTRGSLPLQYFQLKREVESADILSPFIASTAFADSVLCSEALQNLRSVSQELTQGQVAKVRKLKDLEKQLFPNLQGQSVDEETVKTLEAECRVSLAEETVRSLQEEIEGALHSLEKLRARVSSEADSSIMRSALRKKEGGVKKNITKLVDRYNSILPMGEAGCQRQSAVADDLLAGAELPWQFDRCLDDMLEVSPGVHRTMHFKQKYELVEAYNKVRRLQEERVWLMQEQKSYLSFYATCQHELERKIASWDEQLSSHVEEEPPLDSTVGVTGKYYVADIDVARESELMQGTIARLWEAHYDAGEQLRKGHLHFQLEAGGLGLAWLGKSSNRAPVTPEGDQSDPFAELDPEDNFNNVE